MPLFISGAGDVRVNQDGIIPSVVDLTNNNGLAVAVIDGNGDQLTGFDHSRPANSTITPVVVATTSVTLAAANAARRQVILYNDGSNDVFVAFAATASTSSFTLKIPKTGFFEALLNGYTGIITAIRASGSGTVLVTEVTT